MMMVRNYTRTLQIALFLLAMSLPLFSQFDAIINKISEYNRTFPEEILYVHVDREVYNPGDTLWFKAYLRHKVTLQENTLSKSLFMKILNSQGVVVHESIHPIFDSETLGQFEIENELGSGNYQLICYSSWMKNGEYPELYRKAIRIQEESIGKESFRYSLNKRHYVEGDTIRALVSFLDKNEAELYDVNIKYKTKRPGGYVPRGSFNTSAQGGIQLPVDVDLIEAPEMKFSCSYKGYYFDTIVKLPVLGQFELGFYPEGGNLIEGLSNRIAFKVHSKSGIPFEVKGGLYTKEGEKMEDISSDHLGMGSFMLIPESGENYHVLIHEPVKGKFSLPEAQKEGWMLQANCSHQNLVLTLNNTYSEPKQALVTLTVRDFMLRYSVREVDGFDSFTIPTHDLPAGIAVLTLFDDQLRPRAERLVFINQEKMDQVELSTEFSSYLPRDSVSLKVKVSDSQGQAVKGSFSLSVVDEQLSMSSAIDEPGIRSSYLLSPEIKGHIVQAEYYFNQANPDHLYHLDLLLLTQGWRRYRYKHILDADMGSLPPPRIYDVVSGQLLQYKYGRNGVPTRGVIQVYNAGGTAEFETDDQGKFRYIHYYDPNINPNIVLYGLGLKGKEKMEIILDADEFEDFFDPYFEAHADSLFYKPFQPPDVQVDFQDQYTLGLNNKWLEEVSVYAKRTYKIEYIEETFLNSSTVTEDRINSAPDVYGALLNMGQPVEEVRGIGGADMLYYNAYPRGPIHWFVDDFNRDYEFIQTLWTGDIKALFIVKFPDTQMFEIPDRAMDEDLSYVIVSIHTIPFSERIGPPRRSNTLILPKLSMSREFYRPRYDTEARRYSQVPDLRKTIHWEPNVVLDEHGEATITFYNGDRYTRMQCIMEGVEQDGTPVYGESGYQIYTIRE